MSWVSAIVRNGPQLLMVRQRWGDGDQYSFIPGGQVEPNETPIEALARELREETGLTLVSEMDRRAGLRWVRKTVV